MNYQYIIYTVDDDDDDDDDGGRNDLSPGTMSGIVRSLVYLANTICIVVCT